MKETKGMLEKAHFILANEKCKPEVMEK